MTAVYKAISNVAREMAETGIKKGSVNQQQGFMFRGIDAVYNALAPALVKHGLLILPRIIERTVTERQTQRGGLLFYVVVKAEFEFVSVEDGSKHTVVTYGEAMDSGDKATNKAMSIAYKYA
ncbi:ERF family protein, partial [Proteus terrae]